MCFDLGRLQEYLDGESDEVLAREIARHLKDCPGCRERLAELSHNTSLAGVKIESWVNQVSNSSAELDETWDSIAKRVKPKPFLKSRREVKTMLRRYRTAAAVAVVALCLGVALSFGPVRQAAADFLSVFRAEQITTVSIDPYELQNLETALREGGKDIKLEQFGQIQVNEKIELQPITQAEAQQLVDFTVKSPGAVPPGMPQPKMFYSNPATANFTLKVDNVNELLKSFGSKSLLPQGLNGKTFTLSMPEAVITSFTVNGDNPELAIVQSRSPELHVPDGVDMFEVRQALLSLPVLPENLKRQLSAITDWQHTIVVPDMNGSTKAVKVQGVSGVFITDPGAQGRSSGGNCLMWIKDGVIYAVQGNVTSTQALEIANSLR